MKALAMMGPRRFDQALLVVFGLLFVLFAVGFGLADSFATLRNLLNVLEQASALGFVSLGQTLVVLTGGIDLSIGSLIRLIAVLTSGLIDGSEGLVVPVVAGVLVLGAAIGAVNGLVVVLLRVHPLIATLGMASILQGATLLYTLSPPGSVPYSFEFFAFERVLGVPVGGATMLLLFLAVWFFLRFSRLGRQVYAVGGNAEAARLTGIPVRKVLIFVYAACGFFAALTGVYFVSRLGVGDPWVAQGYELASITPVVVGGTILAGGRGGVVGTLLGVFLISLLNNLLNFLDISTYWQWIIQGAIIIVAVSAYLGKGPRP